MFFLMAGLMGVVTAVVYNMPVSMPLPNVSLLLDFTAAAVAAEELQSSRRHEHADSAAAVEAVIEGQTKRPDYFTQPFPSLIHFGCQAGWYRWILRDVNTTGRRTRWLNIVDLAMSRSGRNRACLKRIHRVLSHLWYVGEIVTHRFEV